ncbi:Ig-like domain-containing protein [Clostridium estertheticum]|uniref:Ig-like domain-containing protein n=1 Tax=Clostridium estertheticum TaxID=238834 RepID=UPI001C0D026A|nr:Ig-like domain-containing protein [Clostridium estertheticum]MBU3174120.1 Ig-like domain-containing protein [Clostridium estertheticum]
MNKKITSSVLVALMIAGSTSFSAFAAMPTGTIVIGTKAFDLTYANNSANASEISAAMLDGGSVYFKDYNGDWIDNIKGSKVAASLIPAVTYKNRTGTSNFAASDTDTNTNTVATSVALSAISTNQLKETFNGKVADTSKVVFTVKRGTTPVTMVATWNDAKTEAILTYGDNLPEGTYTVGVMNNTTDIGSSTVAVTKQKVSKIEILGDTVAVDPPIPVGATNSSSGFWPGDGHVSYKVLDQYGVDITENSLASNIKWKSSIGTISVSKGTINISILEGAGLRDVGYLTQYESTIITATDSDSNISQRNTLKFVDKALTVNKIENITKNIGDSYTLPTTVTATLADKTTKDFAVTWDKVASTKIAGQFTFIGTLTMVDGIVNTNNVTASATLIVSMPTIDKTDITSKFTDENFKSSVYSRIGKAAPSPILESDVKDIKSLDLSGDDVSSLSGIEYFTSLTNLNCSSNELTTLDVSKNIALASLDCSNNGLTSIDVSKNIALASLDCSNNGLTSIDVSKNIALTSLECSTNKLPTVEVSKNTALTSLNCSNNRLTALDVSKNAALTSLDCCNNGLTTLDASKNTVLTSLKCSTNKLTTLDVSKNTALTSLGCNYNRLTTLDVSKNAGLTSLDCSTNGITALDVSKNTGLTSLDCSANGITTLDLSKNTALNSLDCSTNQLTTLDVSKNIGLTSLVCQSNKLATLDVGKNAALTTLECENNGIKTIDVSRNTALTTLNCWANQLATLDLSKNTVLTSLKCWNNKLATLNVSKNTALTILECENNGLKTLDISKNTALTTLNCVGNQLTTLYAIKDTWASSVYRPQYTDSTRRATTDSLVITIKH